MLNFKHSHSFETEISRYDVVFSWIYADGPDVVFGKTAHNWWICLSGFANTVSYVFGLSSEKQMVRINTCWPVATMQHIQAVFDIAMPQHPSDSVGIEVAAESWSLNAGIVLESAVAFVVDASNPKPAGFSFKYFRPKTISEWYSRFSHVTSLGSVVRSAARGDNPAAFRYFNSESEPV